ncbi:MAG: hypothetical protein DRO52_01095 [Candidatus Hecatellales archaeon]|nr:MAG: hypothetical protein DRO52_01095 [Candidatus Hecatellales archaeon]RLI33403.1 MAG: hypothetical protein DRO53_05400 [Candidatus Bathyarchaeota archaeon]
MEVKELGAFFRPEELTGGRGLPKPSDLNAGVPVHPLSLQALYEQVRTLREELEKVKRALRRHGIVLEE